MKRLLMIAYHFPPTQGSSGVHRTVEFARHLPAHGWEPLIVSVHPRAYPSIGQDWYGSLPKATVIQRSFALDSARHLSIKKRYLDVTAVPDRWVSWWLPGVVDCLQLIKKFKPHALWSTFPVATAHLIALTVQHLRKLPWVADFRDPMVQPTHPASGLNRNVYKWLERRIIEHSAAGVFVTSSAMEHYAGRYPGKPDNYWQLIENGYSEKFFDDTGDLPDTASDRGVDRPVKMVHSGLLYSRGRNPASFLEALSAISRKQVWRFHVVLRGSGREMDLKSMVSDLDLNDIVELAPPVPYRDAIKEMVRSDILVLFQGPEFNRQIPAKVYEYIRAGRPVLALTDRKGETAASLNRWDGIFYADIDAPDAIEKALTALAAYLGARKKPERPHAAVAALSRAAGTEKLVRILEQAAT